MRVNDNVFSGIIIKKHTALDEVITYNGKVSEDKQMMEFIEITKDDIQYLTGERKDIEKKVKLSARFENIPIWYGSYSFKYGVTKITLVKYNEEYSIPHHGRTESYTESFVKINEEKITKYTTNCIGASFKPGNAKISNKINKKVAVILKQNENKDGGTMKGMGPLIINGFMKISGLKVLERIAIYKITDEIELSQSGLVNPEAKVSADKMMIPDIEVIVTQENRIPVETDLMFESYTVRSKIRIVATGQIIDANLIYNINIKAKATLSWESKDEYVDKVVAFTKNFLYE